MWGRGVCMIGGSVVYVTKHRCVNIDSRIFKEVDHSFTKWMHEQTLYYSIAKYIWN